MIVAPEQRPAAILLIGFLALLTACGGGGGGGGSPGPGPASGGFTLSAKSLSFKGKRGAVPPFEQVISMTLTDSATAVVAAAYKAGVTPPTWLAVTASGLT